MFVSFLKREEEREGKERKRGRRQGRRRLGKLLQNPCSDTSRSGSSDEARARIAGLWEGSKAEVLRASLVLAAKLQLCLGWGWAVCSACMCVQPNVAGALQGGWSWLVQCRAGSKEKRVAVTPTRC